MHIRLSGEILPGCDDKGVHGDLRRHMVYTTSEGHDKPSTETLLVEVGIEDK